MHNPPLPEPALILPAIVPLEETGLDTLPREEMKVPCDCIKEVNAMLASRNTALHLPITLSALSSPDEPQRLFVETVQLEKGRGRPKAVSMFTSYCPFCGQKQSGAA